MSTVRAARFLLGLGLRVDPARLARAVLLTLAGYLAAPLAAVALGAFTDAALAGSGRATAVLVPVVAALLVAQYALGHFAHLDYFELAEMQEARLREELVDIVHRTPGVEHLDDPGFADDVMLVRESLATNTRALESVLQLGGLLVQTALTAAVLVTLDPWLAMLPLTALPAVLLARRGQTLLEGARERSAEALRLHRHLLEISTRAGSVKEIRLFGAGPALLARRERAWQEVTGRVVRARAASAGLRAGGQVLFALGYAAAILLVAVRTARGEASIGDLVLVITLAAQVTGQVTGTLELLGVLQATGRTVQRIEGLRSTADAGRPPARTPPARGDPPPRSMERLGSAIRLEDVSFTYPGADRPVLQGVSLDLPAGHTLALVGENGAGKSTLVKLLCGLYVPTSGRILVDGRDLRDLDPAAWRAGVATLFQDFARLEFTLREGIGLGDAARREDPAAIDQAVAAARAEQVVATVTGGLDGYVGHGYAAGTELSGGQWQTVGLARAVMRQQPWLLILDEPAAALDATAEHALFERYASAASAAARQTGGVTLLVSHRFSTVLMADTIAVLDGGRLVESGSHRELVSGDGLYAELFSLQARAYR